MGAPYLIDGIEQGFSFPAVELACREPNGLLAIGGDLSAARLMKAYQQGIFPWFNEDQPILWWSPDPRAVLFLDKLKVSRSLGKTINRGKFRVTIDTCFRNVIEACAQPRLNQSGTWILPEIIDAYCQLHQQGYAHSVETWCEDQLVGGLYGVAIGKIFCGESMFSQQANASKVALVSLVKHLNSKEFIAIDCQLESEHLSSMGAEPLPRYKFIDLLNQRCDLSQNLGKWKLSN